MIITDRNQIDNKKILVMTSIGGSPIHEGHTRVIRDCKTKVVEDLHSKNNPITGPPIWSFYERVKLLVIVNCDDFLIRKHGFSFQNENSRAEVLDSIKDVDYTFIHQSDKQTIDDAIHYFQPHYFCKGGDRSKKEDLPLCEIEACDVYGCQIIFGCGGTDKVSSSSHLIKRVCDFFREK